MNNNMVQSIIDLGEREDRILNIVKAKFGLKNKSEAVALITQTYEESFLEPELRPEFLKALEKTRKGKYLKFDSIEELRKITS
jgi:hypothetical protein